jgi:hypothetical protein
VCVCVAPLCFYHLLSRWDICALVCVAYLLFRNEHRLGAQMYSVCVCVCVRTCTVLFGPCFVLYSHPSHTPRRVKAGLVPIICVCPETIMAMVKSVEWQEVFANWDDSMVALCYDEVHMIFEVWRSSYPQIPSLRAWFTRAGVMALTATAYVVPSLPLSYTSL